MSEMNFPKPQVRAKLPAVETIGAVGMTFVEGYPDNILSLPDDVQGLLVRNPANPYDRDAIEVHVVNDGLTSNMVGHLPAKDGTAGRLAPFLDAGFMPKDVVVMKQVDPEHPRNPGVSVRITWFLS